jgi:hypothetical protein
MFEGKAGAYPRVDVEHLKGNKLLELILAQKMNRLPEKKLNQLQNKE